jgi:hypothetical protein
MILCDTNILIEFYKGRTDVVKALTDIGVADIAVSVVTVGELYFGARDKRELQRLQQNLALLQQISIDENISTQCLALLEKYVLSHKLSFPDALIAATAIKLSIPLYTLNLKDFNYIPGLTLHSP